MIFIGITVIALAWLLLFKWGMENNIQTWDQLSRKLGLKK